jgi:hypothetical protein
MKHARQPVCATRGVHRHARFERTGLLQETLLSLLEVLDQGNNRHERDLDVEPR